MKESILKVLVASIIATQASFALGEGNATFIVQQAKEVDALVEHHQLSEDEGLEIKSRIAAASQTSKPSAASKAGKGALLVGGVSLGAAVTFLGTTGAIASYLCRDHRCNGMFGGLFESLVAAIPGAGLGVLGGVGSFYALNKALNPPPATPAYKVTLSPREDGTRKIGIVALSTRKTVVPQSILISREV